MKKSGKTIIFVVLLLIGLIIGSSAYAAGDTQPGVIVHITGEKAQGGQLILESADPGYDGSWYPGLEKRGTIRIYNDAFYKVKIGNFGLKVELNPDSKYGIFADKMHLTLKRGTYPAFESTPLFVGPFRDILYQEGSPQYQGMNMTLEIDHKSFIDLECSVSMAEDADKEMQGLEATLNFLISMNAIPKSGNNDSINEGSGGAVSKPPTHWAHDCIVALTQHHIIQPDIDGEIRPDDSITRAETAVFLTRALGLQPQNPLFSGYLDPLPDWARGSIIAASKAGIFKGYPGWLFKANNGITREELSCVLVRSLNLKLLGEQSIGFVDRNEISGWAFEDIKIGVQHSAIGGYPDNTFRPQNPITRAEAFSIICRLMGYHSEHNMEVISGE